MTIRMRQNPDAKAAQTAPRSTLLKTAKDYQALLENIEDMAIITMDTKGYIKSWNAGAEHILKYKKDEVLDKKIDLLFTDDDKQNNMPQKERALAVEKGRAEDERWHKRKGGEPFWGSGITVPLYEGKTHIGFAKMFRDRTTQHEHEVRKDDFVGIAGHELRTPLAIVKSNVELLGMTLKDAMDPEVPEMLAGISEQVDRLAHLITDLLDLSKISSGQLVPDKRRLSMKALLNKTVEYYRALGGKHSIVLTRSDSADVRADKDHIMQVIHNLIGNAIKYSPNADRIEISSRSDDGFVRIEVRDYGPGVSESERQRIFSRFYRIHDRRRTAGGLGIGLFVCREIVRSHGGTIGVEPAPGGGSIFYFTLPR